MRIIFVSTSFLVSSAALSLAATVLVSEQGQIEAAIRDAAVGNDVAALAQVNAIIADSKSAPEWRSRAYFISGEIKSRQGKYPDAVRDLSRSIALRDTLDARRSRAIAYDGAGDFWNEINDLTVYILGSPRNVEALNARGHAFLSVNELIGARSDFELSLKVQSGNIYALVSLVHVAIVERNLELARSYIEQAELGAPDEPTVVLGRGAYDVAVGRSDLALARYDEALRRNADDVLVLFARVNILHWSGQNNLADVDCRRLLELRPPAGYPTNGATTPIVCGQIALDLGQYLEATEYFTRAIAASPQAPSEAYFYRGYANAFAGGIPNALADFSASIKLGPDQYGSYLARGVILLGLGNVVDAQRDFETLIRAGKHAAYADTNFGFALLWLTLIDRHVTPQSNAELSLMISHGERVEWPWPLVEMYAGRVSEAEAIAGTKGRSQRSQDYAQRCSLPFFVDALNKRNTPSAKFDQTAHLANLHALLAACPMNSVERLAATLETAKIP